MKKEIVTIAMLAALAVGSVVSLTACGGGGESGSSAVESSAAPASSVAEVVSSEAAAPSSETTNSTSDFVPSEAGVTITDEKFDISAENLAKSINYYCKTANRPEGKISVLSEGSVRMDFEADEILILDNNNKVSSVTIKSDTDAYEATTHWAAAMVVLLGYDEYFADSSRTHSQDLLKYGADVWNGVGSTFSLQGNNGAKYIIMPD